MGRYYLAQVVTEKEYHKLGLGKEFGTGIIIDGLLGKGGDLLIITVHEEEDTGDGTTITSMDQVR